MATSTDLEKDSLSSESPTHTSDAESTRPREGARGEPDVDHEEAEVMDEGHLKDLERQHVRTDRSSYFCTVTLRQ